jgi:hypothetical protein
MMENESRHMSAKDSQICPTHGIKIRRTDHDVSLQLTKCFQLSVGWSRKNFEHRGAADAPSAQPSEARLQERYRAAAVSP